MEVYAAMIDNMDQGIGRIVADAEKERPVRQHADPLHAGQRRQPGDRRPRRGTRRAPHHPTLPKLGPEHIEPSGAAQADARRLAGAAAARA